MASKGQIDGWFRRLNDGRLEIFLRVAGVSGVADRKIRASGPADEVNELADWFEAKSGLKVSAPWRTAGSKVMAGQMSMEVDEKLGTVDRCYSEQL